MPASPEPGDASSSVPGTALAGTAALVATMDRLRSPGGCPWDAAQTHASLARYLLEETYEVLEALDTGDRVLLREELGDLLLQVVFHTRLTSEDAADPFGFDDVAADVAAKLVRRHPHVFPAGTPGGAGDPARGGAGEVSLETSWEQQKRAEKQRRSVFDGIPDAVPALLLATKMLDRLATSDLGVSAADTPPPTDPALDERAVGAALLALVAAARAAGVEPEQALRGELRRLRAAAAAAEAGSPTEHPLKEHPPTA